MGKDLVEMAKSFSSDKGIQKAYGILEGCIVTSDVYRFTVPAQQPFGHSARLGVKISMYTGRKLGKYAQTPNEEGIVEYPFVDDQGNKVMIWQAHYMEGIKTKEEKPQLEQAIANSGHPDSEETWDFTVKQPAPRS